MSHKYVKEEDTFSTSANGTVPKPTAQEVTDNKFLRADGSWASGAGGSVVSVDQVATSGAEIGGVTIDGVRTAFYAPYHKYSTSEQVVGTWINGKPLYEISVYDTTTRTQNTTAQIDISGLNIETITSVWGMASYGANNTWLVLPFSDDPGTSNTASIIKITEVSRSPGKVKIYIGNNYSGTNAINKIIVTVRYTKTTDTV